MKKILRGLLVAAAVSVGATALLAQNPKGDGTYDGQVRPAAPALLPQALPDTDAVAPPVDPALISPVPLGGRSGLSGELRRTGATLPSGPQPFGPPCQITCTGTPEAETCGADTNGGCTLDFCTTPGFEPIVPGSTVCGTVFADMGVRDLDYYALPVPTGPSLVTIDFNSEFEGQVFLIEAGAAGGSECSASVVLETDFSAGCTPVTIQRAIGTIQYYVAVTTANANGPIFDGVTCAGGNNQYALTVTVVGADCLTCTGTTELDACGITPDTNIGCNAAAAPFPFSGPVAVGAAPVTLCGNCSNNGAARDLDWWEITIPAGSSDVTVEFTSEFPGNLLVINDQLANCDFGTMVLLEEAFSGSCITSTITFQASSGAGRYILVVGTGDQAGPLFNGVPCGNANDYELVVSAVPAACPPDCGLVCAGTAEGELCPTLPNDPDMTNGGCNSPNNAFTAIGIDAGNICGVAWADSGTRDTDWYKFTVFANTTVDLTINSEVPVDYFIVGEANGQAGVLNVPCNFQPGVTLTVNAVGNHPGSCAPVTVPGIALTVDPGIGQRTYILFVGAANAAGPLFSGFPCSCDYAYSVELSTSATINCNIPNGTVTSDCATGQVNLALTAGSAYTAAGVTVDYEGFGAAAGVTGQVVIPGPFAAGAVINQSITLGAGDYIFDLTGDCTAGGTFAAVAAVGHYPYTGQTDLIFAGELDGCVDSVAALEAALAANGRTSLTINNQIVLVSDYDCLSDPGVATIWVALGTFPNNVPLVASEGTTLANTVLLTNQSIYVEGGDVWGFDAPTDFFNVDGVEGLLADGILMLDGDDSLAGLTGNSSGPIDTSTLGAAYNQDNLNDLNGFPGEPGFDYTDQLIVSDGLGGSTGEDAPIGSTRGLVFTESTANYGVAIASEGPDDTTGKVLSSSFEFGGYAGNQTSLMGAYLGFLKAAPPPGGDFRRGDCNNDGGNNIADAVYLLGALFPGMNPPNALNCQDACDGNDDGGLNIADAVAILASLFGSPAVPLPAPGPNCGPDPTTTDTFRCAVQTCP